MMQQVEEDGVYISENMSHNDEVRHVIRNGKSGPEEDTLEGVSFNVTTSIIIENTEQDDESSEHTRQTESISLLTAPSERWKTISNVPTAATSTCHMSARDGGSPDHLCSSIEAVGSLETRLTTLQTRCCLFGIFV